MQISENEHKWEEGGKRDPTVRVTRLSLWALQGELGGKPPQLNPLPKGSGNRTRVVRCRARKLASSPRWINSKDNETHIIFGDILDGVVRVELP
jgi:hypothetical protein